MVWGDNKRKKEIPMGYWGGGGEGVIPKPVLKMEVRGLSGDIPVRRFHTFCVGFFL